MLQKVHIESRVRRSPHRGREPLAAFQRQRGATDSFLLETAADYGESAQFSCIGSHPLLRITGGDGGAILVETPHGSCTLPGPAPAALKRLLAHLVPDRRDLPSIALALTGYFSYDLVRQWEDLPGAGADRLELPDLQLVLPGRVTCFDHRQRTVYEIEHHLQRSPLQGSVAGDDGSSGGDAMGHTDEPRSLAHSDDRTSHQPSSGFVSNVSKGHFHGMVNTAKDHIRRGDIFQVVLSQRWSKSSTADAVSVYRVLRRMNPSPHMFLLDLPQGALVGSSPELLVRVADGQVETHPIAGTRRRGESEEADRRQAADLRRDAKERAEHVMLVDLGRNDLGKVSAYGSVKVGRFMEVEHFSHVMHLVSDVTGTLAADRDAVDALQAVLPAGTLSGAPKVRAMEIIDRLEPHRRGPYGGAVGYLALDGTMETCITIRTVLLRDGRAHVQAGAGIVADSDPAQEHRECRSKVAALFDAITEAEVRQP